MYSSQNAPCFAVPNSCEGDNFETYVDKERNVCSDFIKRAERDNMQGNLPVVFRRYFGLLIVIVIVYYIVTIRNLGMRFNFNPRSKLMMMMIDEEGT